MIFFLMIQFQNISSQSMKYMSLYEIASKSHATYFLLQNKVQAEIFQNNLSTWTYPMSNE